MSIEYALHDFVLTAACAYVFVTVRAQELRAYREGAPEHTAGWRQPGLRRGQVSSGKLCDCSVYAKLQIMRDYICVVFDRLCINFFMLM